jgi:hypothetical protein
MTENVMESKRLSLLKRVVPLNKKKHILNSFNSRDV